MSIELYFHPLASFCWKALIALYENDTPFAPHIVDLGNEAERAALVDLWPLGKFPVVRDTANGRVVAESSIIIEYLAQHYPGPVELIPKDADRALRTRMSDRVFDFYVHQPMGSIVADKLRPAGQKDPTGVAQAKSTIATAYAMIEADMANKTWAMGDSFTMADCSAAPALFYASRLVPFGETTKNVAAYLDRLLARPSFSRVVKEAQPYFHMFPG